LIFFFGYGRNLLPLIYGKVKSMFTFCALIDQPDIQFITVGIDAKLFGVYIMCFSAAFGAISGNPKGVFQDNFIFNFL